MQTPFNQQPNPTDEQRHEILRASLERAGRPDDYDAIINLLSPPKDITAFAAPGDLRGVKIGIIGGGLAGLSAAFELRKLGAEITILKACEDRIGGRVYTWYFDKAGKYYGEFGAMRIPVSHETTWHYINLFGLGTQSMTSPERNNFLYVHNTRLRISDSIQDILYPKYDLTPQERAMPYQELYDYAFTYLLNQLSPGARAELISILPEYSPELLPLMNTGLRKTLESLGLSQGAISLLSGTNPMSGALLNISYDEIIQEEYIFNFMNVYNINGGNACLPYAFYRSFLSPAPPQYRHIPKELLGNVSYKPGHYVTGIYQSDYRSKVVLKYKNLAENCNSADIFDYIICAIPFSVLREVEIKPRFSNMKMQAIQELNYIDAQKTLFLCSHRFWERDTDYGNMRGGISFTDLPIQSIIYPSDHDFSTAKGYSSPEEPGVLTASYNLAQNAVRLGGMDPEKRFELICRNVEEVHGLPRGFLNSLVEKHKTVHWNNEPNFRGGFALAYPGQKPLFSYEMLQPEYNGRVFFAGEHISPTHGWMQGALYSGKAAANSLAENFRG